MRSGRGQQPTDGDGAGLPPFFVPVTILVMDVPAALNPECMVVDAFPDEAIDKLDEYCHRRLGIPLNWLVCHKGMQRMAEKLRRFHDDYGDEVGILEWSVYGRGLLVPGLQSWVEALGLERPEGDAVLPWHQLDEEYAARAFSFLKADFERHLGFEVTLAFGANGGDALVRALKRTGFHTLWGYNWNLYGDGVDATGRGTLPDPFFISSSNAKIPAEPGDTALVAAPWGAGDYANIWQLVRQCRLGINNVCLNPHELANRAGAVDACAYVEKMFARAAAETWNPYRFVPLQCEAHWLDESGLFYAHHPDFAPRCVEMFFHEIETALEHRAEITTFSRFHQWLSGHFDRTPDVIHVCEDLLPDTRFRGKDGPFSETVVASGADGQAIFEKSHGFSYVRKYSYVPPIGGLPPTDEYPGLSEPPVELQVKAWTSPRFGLHLRPGDATYEFGDLDRDCLPLTSERDEPDYQCVIWHANLPDYVTEDDLELSDNIRGIRIIHERNLALLKASLTRGNNELRVSSHLPARHIHMEEPRLSGRRYEILIHNDASPAGVSFLDIRLEKNLRIGGFWWNGRRYPSIYHFNYSPYIWRTGELRLFTAWPDALTLKHGTTRCSFEIEGRFDPQNPAGQ